MVAVAGCCLLLRSVCVACSPRVGGRRGGGEGLSTLLEIGGLS